MKHWTRFPLIIALLFIFTGIFIFISERADARAGGGQFFSVGKSFGGGSRGFSSVFKFRSSSHSSDDKEAERRETEWMKAHWFLIVFLCLSVFAATVAVEYKPDSEEYDSSEAMEGGLGLAAGAFLLAGATQSVIFVTIIIMISLFLIAKRFMCANNYAGTSLNNVTNIRFNHVKDYRSIIKKDPGFKMSLFILRVKKAFMLIQDGWSRNDLSKCEAFMADGTYERFQIQINEMIANKITDKMDGLEILEAYITKIESNSGYDSVYVVINAIGKNYRFNSVTKKFIEGDKAPTPFTEIWCFMRRTGSKTINDKGLIEGFCPNCGTPIEGSRLSRCPSCDAQLRSGEHDWVLTGITQASEWRETHNKDIPGMINLWDIDPDFNIQNIEDKISVMFWRMCEANRTNSANPIRKIATDSFITKYQNSKVAFGKLNNIAIGSTEIVGIVTDIQDFSFLLGQVTWSGKNTFGNDSYNKSLFVLKRSSNCKTDSKKSFTSMHCPNCGAPMKISADNFCEYCNTAANDLNKDWLLENILDYNCNEANTWIRRAMNAQPSLQINKTKQGTQNIRKPQMPQANRTTQVVRSSATNSVGQTGQGVDYSDIRAISEKDLMRITIAMMLADGVIDAREKQLIYEISRARTSIREQEVTSIIESMRKLPNPVDYTLNTVAIPSNYTLLRVLINIAAADGVIAEPEIMMLYKVAAKMHIAPLKLRNMINEVYESNWNKK